jgi:hypothetical protein
MDSAVVAFSVQKAGTSATENEDAYRVGDDDPRFLRVTVADGASESMLASRWARHLVAVFGAAPESPFTEAGFIAVYQRAAQSWAAEVDRYKRERAARKSPIQWYEEPGLARGAYSTLLAAEFRPEPDGGGAHWSAAALGDSCLFQVRGEKLLTAFPMKSSDDFGNQPPLLSTKGVDAEVLGQYLNIETGVLAPQDTCYLATDALSAWFLKTVETGDQPWRRLRVLDDIAPGEFTELIAKLRDDNEIRDDDTTLVRVDM